MKENEMELPKRPGNPVYVDNRGNPQTRDESYSADFWQRQPNGMRETMEEEIKKAFERGVFYSMATGDTEIDERTKEKLSAYRILAEGMGYIIGPFKWNKNSETVEANIIKKE